MALWVATAAGAGHSPVAPGTAGSLVALAILWFVPFSTVSLAASFILVVLAGVWAGDRAERLLKQKDPSVVVIDEVAGMMLSVLTLPSTPMVLLSAFALFRLFDIVKPFPCRQCENFVGGIGVMLDDLVAGAYTLLLLLASRAILGLPR